MRSVRIWFTKTGTARYISHLDLTRCMIRAIRRTNIPIWYTEGFNPHPHLVFGLSLPLGAEGINEAVDIRLDDDDFTNEEVLAELLKTEIPGIRFIKTDTPKYKCMEIISADYRVKLPKHIDNISPIDTVNEKLNSGSVLIEKKVKKKDPKIINVCEYIKETSFEKDEAGEYMLFTLPAGNDFTINPISFCNSLFEDSIFDEHTCIVTRLMLRVKNGEEYI